MNCNACGAEILDIDVRCGACGMALSSTGAQRMVGEILLGQYEVTDVLGQGGMSVVYKGRHTLTDQEVALKILPPELAAHSQVKSRFVEEAKALAQLDHPNIVHLYNFGQENGSFVLAMQLVKGPTWERMILEEDEASVDWGRHLWITIDVLKALEYAHDRGIVHRDMKPSNVLVRDHDGLATVMDFGIAKITGSSKLTATGQTMGTVRYMSPEQVRGLSVDLRTDIYSLGCTLYEAIVGDTPFDGDTHFEIMTKHLSEAPTLPSAHGVVVPEEFERLLLRSLAKKPEERFESAREFRKGLEGVLAAHDVGRAETVRIDRPQLTAVARPTKLSAAEALGGLADALEPGSSDSIAALGLAGTVADAGEITDVGLPKAKPRRQWWIALAVLVVVASGGVAIVLARGGGSKPRDAHTAVDAQPPASKKSPRWPAPLSIPTLSFKLDQTFQSDEIRVMSVQRRDPEIARAAVASTRDRFREFLHAQGIKGAIPRQPITVQIVPQWVLCDVRIYRDRSGKKGEVQPNCQDKGVWYRPNDRTLVVTDASAKLRQNISSGVALATCLHVPLDGCAGALPAFDRAQAVNKNHKKKGRTKK